MATVTAARAKGRCPDCGRVISGRAVGIQARHADRKFVALRPHVRTKSGNKGVPCLLPGGYRVVPRDLDRLPTTLSHRMLHAARRAPQASTRVVHASEAGEDVECC